LVPAQDPHQGMNDHGAMVMGFDQAKTAHHFYLYDDGGALDISVKDAADTKDRDGIRRHLPHIAMMFGTGDFDAPMLVHDTEDVPGIDVLTTRNDRVRYTYVETPAGGRVNIVTTDRDALAALHAFLAYQIKEHRTGDSMTVTKRP
ncbi:MAG: hypothetical protein ACRD1V_17045, partial [Vicinamibacterales bacterium]